MTRLFALSAVVLLLVATGIEQDAVAGPAGREPSAASPQGGDLLQGDVDCSGGTDALDALALLRDLAGIGQPPACLEAADVDCNGASDATDALKILQFVAGLTVSQTEHCPDIGEALGDVEPPPPAGPTSGQLIAGALEAGEIDEETALLYEVYADVNYDLLPAQYRGDDSDLPHGDGLWDARERFDDLSPDIQDAIRPYLLHPFDPGSIENLGGSATASTSSEWQSTSAAGEKALVWWRHPADQPRAEEIASLIGSVWTELTELIGREPMSDANESNNGGDGRLDIFITDALQGMILAYAEPYGTDFPTPGILRVTNRDASSFSLPMPFLVAHEFVHLQQFAFEYANQYPEYLWWWDSAATWAPAHVLFPELKVHNYARRFLEKPHLPLETFDFKKYPYHPYGSSVFLFFLTKEHGDDGLVRRMHEAMKDNSDSLEAIDKTVPGGIDGNWEKFLRYNWNPDWEPLNQYRDWQQGFDERATPVEGYGPRKVSLAGKQDERIELIVGLDHLSSEYYHFEFDDDAVSTVVVHNGWTYELEESTQTGINWLQENALPAEEKEGASLQALIKIEGKDWVVEDLSDQPGLYFCRDEADERLEELVLIFGNSRHEDRQDQMFARGLDTTLLVSNYACYGWEGTAETTIEADGVTQMISANMTWEATGGLLGPIGRPAGLPEIPTNLVGLSRFYLPVSGDLSWSISGTDSQGCTHSGSANFQLGSGFESGNSLVTWNGVLPGDFYRTYYGLALSMQPATYTVSCPGMPPQQGFGGTVVAIGSHEHIVSADGRTMNGTLSAGDANSEWSLMARRE